MTYSTHIMKRSLADRPLTYKGVFFILLAVAALQVALWHAMAQQPTGAPLPPAAVATPVVVERAVPVYYAPAPPAPEVQPYRPPQRLTAQQITDAYMRDPAQLQPLIDLANDGG